MGLPRGSKNKSKENGDGLRNTVSGPELRDYILRIEQCNAEQKEISADRQQIFAELKQAGYNRDTVRSLVRERKMTREEREIAKSLMDQYASALGDFIETPLGRAGAPHAQEAHAG